MESAMSQKKEILYHLQQNGTITPIEALNKIGCFRLSARIKDLRDDGHHIQTNMVKRDGKEFAEYKLIVNEQSTMFHPKHKGAYSR